MSKIEFAKPKEPVEFDGERCTPWVSTQILSAHVHRYLTALPVAKGKRVLDIASGEGYGAAMLERNGAGHVTGVDIDTEAVARAKRVYGNERLSFVQADIREPLPLDDNAFDVIVSFETIEHIAEHEAFLAELARVLTPDGALIISTPDAIKSDPTMPNPFHAQELTEDAFLNLLKIHFQHVTPYYQGYQIGSVMRPADGSDETQQFWTRDGFLAYEEDGGARLKHYILAVASNQPGLALPTGMLHDGAIVGSLNRRIRELEAEVAELSAIRHKNAI